MAALLRASGVAFDVLRMVGVAYLLMMAVFVGLGITLATTSR